MMNLVRTLALGLSLSLAAAPALAAPRADVHGAAHKADRAGKGDHGKFPMGADAFRKKVDERIEKAKKHLETHIEKKKVNDAKAKELRARFDGAVSKVRAEVDKVCADGTVTKEEAKSVHQLARELAPKKHKK